MPTRPGRGEYRSRAGKFSIGSFFGGTQGDPNAGAAGVNPEFEKEEQLHDEVGADYIAPKKSPKPFTDERKRFLGFGPRMGSNTAQGLNNEYAATQQFGSLDARQQANLQRLLGDIEFSQLERTMPLELKAKQDAALATFYGGRGTRANIDLEGQMAKLLGVQNAGAILQGNQANQLSQDLFPGQRSIALNQQQLQDTQVLERLRDMDRLEGRNAFITGNRADMMKGVGPLLTAGETTLGPGQVSHNPMAKLLGTGPDYIQGPIPNEEIIMTQGYDPVTKKMGMVPSDKTRKTVTYPDAPVSQAELDALHARITGNANRPQPAVAPATVPAGRAAINAMPQRQPQAMSPEMQATSNQFFGRAQPSDALSLLSPLQKLLSLGKEGLEDLLSQDKGYVQRERATAKAADDPDNKKKQLRKLLESYYE